MFNLITVGDTVIDTHVQIDDATIECKLKDKPCQLCLDFATKIPIKNSFQSLGGNAANVAVGATKLGLKTSILTFLGNDSNGKLAFDELEKFKVNTDLIHIENKKQTRYSVVLNFQGERTILSYHGKRKYTWPSKTPTTNWIYYTGLSEGFKKLQSKMLKFLLEHPDIRLAFNPGSYQIKEGMNEVKKIIKKTEILILNLQEAKKILNIKLTKEENINLIIKKLLRLGAGEVVITDGQKGAWVGNSKIWKMGSYPVEVNAKTGAGDAFSSGYLSARFYGYNIPQSLRWGIANSCGVIQKVGAQNGLLNKKQIKKMTEKYSDIVPTLV